MSAPRDGRVGPVLLAGATADAIIAAIQRLNTEVEIVDRGAYLRVRVPKRCRLTRAALEAELQAAVRLPSDLERVMPAFAGRLTFADDEALWELVEK